MNRYNPTFSQTTVAESPVLVYTPTDNDPFMPAVVSNRGNVVVRVQFAPVLPAGSISYWDINPGKAIETNPPAPTYASCPNGGTAVVKIARGLRPVQDSGMDAALAQSAAQLLESGISQEELLARITLQLGVGLRYLAEMADEELKESDALVI